MKRIIFHAVNHIGLGHINRTLTIAQWILEKEPKVEILFFVEDESVIKNNPIVPWIKIPSIYDFKLTGWQKISEELRNSMVTGIVSNVIGNFQTDLFIFDTILWYPILHAVQSSPCKKLYIARMGELPRDLFKNRPNVINSMDKIILPHNPNELVDDRELIEQFIEKIVITGPIIKTEPGEINIERVKGKYQLLNNSYNIIITAGGGGWQITQPFINCMVAAIKKVMIITNEVQIHAILITGPHYTGEIERTNLSIDVYKFVPDLMDLMATVDLVICQAGSTLNEISEIGVPAICIPTPEADDQMNRATFFSENFSNIKLGNLEVNEITNQILEIMNKGRFSFSPSPSTLKRFNDTKALVVDSILSLL
jgi:predicted glycosyltransferase